MKVESIAHQILKECGYNSDEMPKTKLSGLHGGWHRVRASYCNVINYPLIFIIAINRDGRIWLARGISTTWDLCDQQNAYATNLHDPQSIDIVKKTLIKIREDHYAAYS